MPIDGWIKKMWYIYTVEYYSAIKRNKIGSFVETWMDLETHTEWSKSEREKQISYISAYMWNLEKWYRWTGLQGRNWDTDVDNKCMYTKGGKPRGDGGGGVMNRAIGIDMYTLMCIKLMTNKNLLYKKINKIQKLRKQKQKIAMTFMWRFYINIRSHLSGVNSQKYSFWIMWKMTIWFQKQSNNCPEWLYNFTFPPAMYERSHSPCPHQHLVLSLFFFVSNSKRCAVIIHCGFNLQFLNG